MAGRDADADRAFVTRLTAWFSDAARPLPWRDAPAGRRDPYNVLVSELMLQQTQVSRVVERFGVFIARFPTVGDLAAADEADVLALWAGMGYYRRARLLHAAARAVVERHGGEIPRDPAALRALPGVGRYTAGAIASIAFGLPEPIVDGNVSRVLLRVQGRGGVVTEPATAAWVWDRAGELVAAAERVGGGPGDGAGVGVGGGAGVGPGLFNEAMMELGATVCTPKAARCGACPVAEGCEARRTGRVEEIPAPKPRARRKTIEVAVVVAEDARGRLLVERRGETGLWAGIWQAPSAERDGPAWTAAEAAGAVGIAIADAEPALEFDHQTTHRDVRFRVWLGRGVRATGGRVWKTREEIRGLALGTPQKRILLEMAREQKAR